MKEYEKLAKEYCMPKENETANRLLCLAATAGFEGGFLNCRKMALELQNHQDADEVPSWVFVCLAELGEKEV